MLGSKQTLLGADLDVGLCRTTTKLWTLGKSWAIIRLHLCLPMCDQLPDGKSHFSFVILSPVLNAMPDMVKWNQHPRVFLSFDKGATEAKCPYCGTEYKLIGPAKIGH